MIVEAQVEPRYILAVFRIYPDDRHEYVLDCVGMERDSVPLATSDVSDPALKQLAVTTKVHVDKNMAAVLQEEIQRIRAMVTPSPGSAQEAVMPGFRR